MSPFSASLLRVCGNATSKIHFNVAKMSSAAAGYTSQKLVLPSSQQPINYVKVGDGDRPTMLLPGALGTAQSDLTTLLDGLNSRGKLTLIAWDPPGYGDSRPPARTWPLNYFERDAEFAVEFMKELGYDKFNVVGWSDGGITGLVAATRHPSAVSKLAVWGSQGHVTDHDMNMLSGVSDISKWSDRMRKPMEDTYGKEGFTKLWAEFNQAFKDIHGKLDGKICNLEDVACPTLIVHGDKDAMVDPVHPDNMAANIMGSRLHRFPDGKHNLHLKYKEEFNQLVEDFLLE